MKTTLLSLSVRRSFVGALALASMYALFLLVLPSAIGALERPVVDRDAIRDDANSLLCDAVDAPRCTSEDTDGDDTDNGGGGDGDTDPGDDTDGDNGGGGSGGGTTPGTIEMTIRTEDGVVENDTLTLPRSTARDIMVTPDNGGNAVAVDPQSALAQLIALDDTSDAFEITDLQYYPSFSAFYLSCITVVDEGELCGEWQYKVNNVVPQVGMDSRELISGDEVVIYFGADDDSVTPTPTPSTSTSGGGGGTLLGAENADKTFDVPAALAFMHTYEEKDGSYDSAMLTDWVALALVAGSADTKSIEEYLANETDAITKLTDHERRAMALLALDLDADEHIDAIREAFGGVQIGDPAEVNDDIFGLIVLAAAGYDADDEVVVAVLTHLVKEQGTNGAWDNDIDLTSAAVQALSPFADDNAVAFALGKARVYLRAVQEDDGGFGNPFATAWALQAISAYGDEPSEWEKDGNDPLRYLANAQESDGGVLPRDADEVARLWATAYAVPAVLGMTWDDLLTDADAQVTVTATRIARSSDGSTTKPVAGSTGTTGGTGTPPSTQLALARTPAVPSTPSNDTATPVAGDGDKVDEGDAIDDEVSENEADQLASAADAAERGASTMLRILALVFAAGLIGYAVFTWRKA